MSLNEITHLRSVLERLNLELPAGPAGEGFTPYQERNADFHRRLNLQLSVAGKKTRLLVSGQIGVGKSTELHRACRALQGQQGGGWCVFCDLEVEANPERCGATGVFLTILRDCWKVASHRSHCDRIRAFDRLREEIFTRLTDWLGGRRGEDGGVYLFPFGGMDYPVFTQDLSRGLSILLGKAAHHASITGAEGRYQGVPDSLSNLLNRLLRALAELDREGRITLVIDHTDKIRDNRVAEEVFLQSSPLWEKVDAGIIMTAPYEFTRGRHRDTLEEAWGRPLVIYPVKLPEPTPAPLPSFYTGLVNDCGLAGLVEEEALRHLAHFSGGIPRYFLRFLQQACIEAHLDGGERIGLPQAQRVVAREREAYLDLGAQSLDVLDEIDRSGSGLGLDEASMLLRSPIAVLIRDPGEEKGHFMVHPLAGTVLEHHRALLKAQGA